MNPIPSIQSQVGNIDIYLFDLILKGRLDATRSVLDLGCGGGRNLVYFLRQGLDVHGLDMQAEAISVVQELSRSLAPNNPLENFKVGTIEQRPFGTRQFDLVICNAVLHFARDDQHFSEMLHAAWDSVAPGGIFFARLASKIGIEDKLIPLGSGNYRLPDGSTRYLVDEAQLLQEQQTLGAEAIELLKTSNVQGLRCMSTWVLRKPAH